MKKYVFLIFLLSNFVYGQNEVDALRYSMNDINGSARILGFGGASQSLGAEIGTISNNPAGLGMFRTSAFGFSSGMKFSNNETNFNSNLTSDSKDNFNFSNIGLVLTSGNDEKEGWKSFSIGFSFSRLGNFHERIRYKGMNNTSSINEFFANQVTENYSNLDEEALFTYGELAYLSYLTTDGDGDGIYNDPLVKFGGVLQEETILNKGSMNQWDIAAGFNYNDELYLGGSIGIQSLRFEQSRIFKENDVQDTIRYFKSLILEDELKTTGTGVNLTFGAIYRPIDMFRVGISLQTPTYYSMEDAWSISLTEVVLDENPDGHEETLFSYALNNGEKLYSDYKLRTPYRLGIGGSLFFNKTGFVTADIEYINYSLAQLTPGKELGLDDFNNANDNINQLYRNTLNYKLGGEIRSGDFSFRIGFAYNGDPYKKGEIDNIDRSKMFYTGGIGYRNNDFAIDFTLINEKWNSAYSPYYTYKGNQPIIKTKHFATNVIIGLNWKF